MPARSRACLPFPQAAPSCLRAPLRGLASTKLRSLRMADFLEKTVSLSDRFRTAEIKNLFLPEASKVIRKATRKYIEDVEEQLEKLHRKLLKREAAELRGRDKEAPAAPHITAPTKPGKGYGTSKCSMKSAVGPSTSEKSSSSELARKRPLPSGPPTTPSQPAVKRER